MQTTALEHSFVITVGVAYAVTDVTMTSRVQVLGCQSRRMEVTSRRTSNNVILSDRVQRDQWPADNGSTCWCYDDDDSHNSECIATCGAGVRNHHIHRSSGTGLVTATCTPGRLYKKSELMLIRRARAYSSFCSQVILVYLYPFRRNSLFCSQKSPKKITKN